MTIFNKASKSDVSLCLKQNCIANAPAYELARRFDLEADELKRRVLEASQDFQSIFSQSQTKAGFELWYLPVSPAFSFCVFDHIAILALYDHRKERGAIPTFVAEEGGSLFDFVQREFESFVKPHGGMGRQLFPAK